MKILHVETSKVAIAAVTTLCRERGIEYVSAGTFEEAVKILHQQEVHLIFLSLELPAKGSDRLVDYVITGEYRVIPLVVVTATESLEVRERFFRRGITDYILKDDLKPERLDRFFRIFNKNDPLAEEMRSLRYAVVDDSRTSRQVLQNILTLGGILEVQFFSSPQELLKSSLAFDIFLVDMVLPGMGGEALISHIREVQENAVILALSEISHYKSITTVLDLGADEYVIKPFDSNVLMARLRSSVRTYRLLKKLDRLANTDPLTGCDNHRKIHVFLEESYKSVQENQGTLYLAISDLDHFKLVNDIHGHQAGDLVLRDFVKCAQQELRAPARIGRHGGEEFFLIFPDMPEGEVLDILERIRTAWEQTRFRDYELRSTVSIGVTSFQGDSLEILMRRADQALYQAKGAGRNKVVLKS